MGFRTRLNLEISASLDFIVNKLLQCLGVKMYELVKIYSNL